MEQYDIRVDAYIEKSADFAKPILIYVRELMHESSPLITETIKWGVPFFEYNGLLCAIAAFKHHCAVNLWKASLLNDPDKILRLTDGAAGQFGKLTNVEQLPAKEVILDFIKQVMVLNEAGVKKVKKS